jgi:predicted helicase
MLNMVIIANKFIERIKAILNDSNNQQEITVFNSFVDELKTNLNDSVSDKEVIEMLAQHMITGPAFDAIFGNNSFVKRNPVSRSINKVLESFSAHHLENEAVGLADFYDSVIKEVNSIQDNASDIDNILGKQKIITELYDKFFRRAFPKMAQRLGIVYTPVEVVDFIIHSVDELLRNEFGKNLGSKDVHIIDPFTGTGTFITRLLQSGLIAKKVLPYKYKNEIHANEIVLLAYYIASLNIALIYSNIIGGEYEPFNGISLTDTFKHYDKFDLISNSYDNNTSGQEVKSKLPLKVIMSNPPYSIGQKSQNDSNKNVAYEHLDLNIKNTYVKNSTAILSKAMYDHYIRAIRWASDRLAGDVNGIIGFITNNSFIEKTSLDGVRISLAKEFQKIYVINLRGNIRKSFFNGNKAPEGENIFDESSTTGSAIIFLVKNYNTHDKSKIYYYDIGENLKCKQKRDILSSKKSISGLSAVNDWKSITPDAYGDWISLRDESFSSHIVLGSKIDSRSLKIFDNYSLGVNTARSQWCINYSYNQLCNNMKKTIDFYNNERKRFHTAFPGINKNLAVKKLDTFLNMDPLYIKWSRELIHSIAANKIIQFNLNANRKCIHKPFTKSWLYYNKDLNERRYQIRHIFPSDNINNKTICVPSIGLLGGFTPLVSDIIPISDLLEKAQCFSYYSFEPVEREERSLFNLDEPDQDYIQKFNISKEGLKYFQEAYPSLSIDRQALFNYIYGLLHSPDYRERYANNLNKELPRIPKVKKASDFQDFMEAGEALAKLHLSYETVEKYPVEIISEGPLSSDDYYVTKMKFGKNGNDNDYTTIIYNNHITVKGIPLEAYDYVVTGRSAIKWVMMNQSVRTDKASGIVNDANLWAIETMDNPKYPLELLQRVITVSLETLKIVRGLPKLDF